MATAKTEKNYLKVDTSTKEYTTTCKCGHTQGIGAWAAAHLGDCDMVGTCPKCGTSNCIPKEDWEK